MRRFAASISALLAAIVLFGVDQVTKSTFPVVYTTSRVPLGIMIVAVIAVLMIGWFQRSLIQKILIGIMVGAASGNMFDLVRFGDIRDIFTLGPIAYNIADTGIFFSLLALLYILINQKDLGDRAQVG